jgi:hypothetical protein
MSELATSRSDAKEVTSPNQEVAPGEDFGQTDLAGFSPGKSFNPKLSDSNQLPLNRESVMRLQHVIGNQAVMRLIATQKQAATQPQPAPVAPTTIQRKIQVDLDQFKGLSHFGNQLLNTTFVQIKSKYKAYLKTNDPAKETKLIGDLLKLCDQWMINHAALQKNKDTKKLDVITNLKLAIAEESATKQQVVTDKSGKKVTFDPKGATVIKPQPPVAPPTPTLQGVGKVGAPGGSPIAGPGATETDMPQGGGGMSDALGYREDIEPDTNAPQTGGGMSDALGYREDIGQGDDSSGGSGTPQNNIPTPPPSQGGGGMGGGLEARAEVETETETETEEDSGQGQGGGGQQGLNDPRMELIKRIGFPPAYIQSLGQPDFDLLVKADKALDDGDVVEADKSFALLRTSLGGVVNMLKGFMMRFHMGNIHPELSKMMDDPNFVATSDQAQKAQDHVNDLGKKFFATGKTGNTDYKDVSGAVDKKQQNTVDPKFAGLSIQEATAIVGYLSDLYPNYNNPLRMGIGQTTGNNAFGEESLNLTATAISALNKLRPHSGMVFRHSGVFPGYLEVNQVGAVIPDLAFMSSAKHQSGTQGGENHDSLEVILDTKSGKDMEHAAWFGGESEILFKPGTRFRVLARLDLTKMSGGQWPTDGQAASMGLSANELILIQYVNTDDKKDILKHLILKKEA